MNKRLSGLLVLLSIILVLAGCEDVFTTSAFESLAKSPSDMTASQLESYAEDALSSGNSAAMAETYTALAATLAATTATEDPELYLLATELALGGSGLTDVIVSVVPDVMKGTVDMNPAYYEELLESLDQDMIAGSVTTFEAVAAAAAADDSIEISPSQYTNAAVAQALVLLDEADGDTAVFETVTDEMQNVLDWAELGGLNLNDLFGDDVTFGDLEL